MLQVLSLKEKPETEELQKSTTMWFEKAGEREREM
jgi:hypothetical protein